MTTRLLAVVLGLAAVSWHANGYAESLGRLFFTPDQRQRLDAGKRLQEEAAEAAVAPVRRGPSSLTLNGMVLRNDGQNTIWVNGHPTSDKASGHITAVPTNDRAAARITAPGTPTTKLRVGQRLDTNSGSIRENYAQRPRTARQANSRTEDDTPQTNQNFPAESSTDQR